MSSQNQKTSSIKTWSEEDRPREKLLLHGCRVLSDAELIAILLGSGSKELSAVELARKILAQSDNNLAGLGKLSIRDFTKIKGVGNAKAITIAAALELGRRRAGLDVSLKPKINNSSDVFNLFSKLLSDIQHEEFWVAYLNRNNIVMDYGIHSQGGLSGTVADVRIIMSKALEVKASSLIICHNHPSGNISPSDQDKQITKKIRQAAELFDISLLDHVIISHNNFFSFADEALI